MIKCRMVERKEGIKLKAGDMFYLPNQDDEQHLIVILPNGGNFNLTTAKRLWEITGEPPEITVNPSIHAEKTNLHEEWHGWLKNGVFEEA